MVTMKDIAKEAGVSVMTVSRVVNGQHTKVSEQNIIRIQEIIKKHNYVPNSNARTLSSKSSRIISLVVRGTGNVLNNPYNAEMTGEIAALVQERNYYLMLHAVDKYDDLTQKLRAWNTQGAIFIGTFDNDVEQIVFDNRIPLVFTDSYSTMRQLTNIGLDDYKGGRLAAKHLLEKGHRQVAFVGGALKSNVVNERLKGFQDELKQAGLELDPSLLMEFTDPMSEVVERLLANPKQPTGVFLTADLLAQEFMYELDRLGYSVPDKYSVIGFDDLRLSGFTSPPMTTIAQDLRKKAQCATDALFRRMEDPSAPSEGIILDVNLVSRATVKDFRK